MKNRRKSLLARTIIFLPSTALSFCREKISLRKNCRIPVRSVQVQISSQDLQNVFSDELTPNQDTELWLDLRPNAIHPKIAIEQLETQLGATSFVDRVLLSETVFQNLIDTKDMYLGTSQILYQVAETDDIFLSSSQGLSTPFGNSSWVRVDSATPVEDPIEAIEQISCGRWLLLEKNGGRIDEELESLRMDTIGNFVDIVSSSCKMGNWDSSILTNGLIIPRTDVEEEESDISNLGGVAVACDTNSEVMKLASTLQLKQGGETRSVTESGIILQGSVDSSKAVTTAAVLPFVVDSWQVATLVFGKGFLEKDDVD